MSNNNLSQLDQKKRALEIELSRIENDLDKTLDGVKADVSNNFTPKSIIRRYPLPIVGAALVLGVLLGKGKSKSSKNKSNSSKGIGSVAGRELKNALAKKGVHFLINNLESSISRIKEQNVDKNS